MSADAPTCRRKTSFDMSDGRRTHGTVIAESSERAPSRATLHDPERGQIDKDPLKSKLSNRCQVRVNPSPRVGLVTACLRRPNALHNVNKRRPIRWILPPTVRHDAIHIGGSLGGLAQSATTGYKGHDVAVRPQPRVRPLAASSVDFLHSPAPRPAGHTQTQRPRSINTATTRTPPKDKKQKKNERAVGGEGGEGIER